MCMPVTVATGGKVNGCVGICKVWPQIIGLAGLGGVLIWNFRSSVARLGSGKANA